MAASQKEIIDAFKTDLKESIKIDFSPKLNEQGMKREGTDNAAEYIMNTVQDGFLKQAALDLPSAANFFPIQLDPNVYDQSSLYGITPLLTYLESKARRTAASTTKFNFIKLTQGFQEEWITPEGTTTGTEYGATDLGEAQICYEAVPFDLSDLLGIGQTVGSRAQVLGFIQETLREGLEKVLITGDKGTEMSPTNKFDGLFTIAEESGIYKDNAGAEITLEALRGVHADLRQRKKGYGTFVLTDEYTHASIQKNMAATIRNVNTVDNIIAGVNPTAFQTSAGQLPIIVSPFSPMTMPDPEDGSKPTDRKAGIFNERFINIQDLITPSWVAKGRTKPLTSDGWILQATVMFNNVPSKTAALYNIDS